MRLSHLRAAQQDHSTSRQEGHPHTASIEAVTDLQPKGEEITPPSVSPGGGTQWNTLFLDKNTLRFVPRIDTETLQVPSVFLPPGTFFLRIRFPFSSTRYKRKGWWWGNCSVPQEMRGDEMDYQRRNLFLQASQQNILMHLLFKHSCICKQPDEREVSCSSSIISARPNWSAEVLGLDLTCFEPGEKQTSAKPALN